MQKIIIILIAAFAFCELVFSQEHQYSSMEEIMNGILRGERDAAVYLAGFKQEIENSEEWDEDTRRTYINCIKGLVEYCSLVGWYIDQDRILSDAMRVFNQRDSEINNPYTRNLWLMKVRAQYEIKNYDSGLNYAHQALQFYEDVNDFGLDYSLLLINISQCYLAKEDYLSAYLYAEESFDIFQKLMQYYDVSKEQGYYHIQNVRGMVLTSLGKYDEAIECFSDIIGADNHNIFVATIHPLALNNIAVAYSKKGDHKKAIEYFLQVGKLTQSSNSTLLQNLTMESFWNNDSKETYEYLCQYNNAVYKNSRSVLANFSEVEREDFLRAQNKELVFINNLVSYIVPDGREEAFDANLYTQSISLALNKAMRRSTANSNELKRLNALRDLAIQKDLSHEQRDSLRREILETERKILGSDRNIISMTDSLIGSMDKIRPRLNSDEILVQFCYLPIWKEGEVEPHYGAFILNQEDSVPELVLLGNVDDIEDLFYNTSPSIEYINDLYSGEKASKLYSMLWSSIEPYLSNKKSVFYSVVGPLSLINFDALIDSDGMRLRDKYNIYMISSPSILLDRSSYYSNKLSDFVAFASPNFDLTMHDMESRAKQYTEFSGISIDEQLNTRGDVLRGSWQALPGTRKEAENILRIFRDGSHTKTNSFFGNEATEEAFKSLSGNSPALLHIATHGFVICNQSQYDSSNFAKSISGVSLNNDYMIWSGLILAGGNNTWKGESVPANVEDGILTADEISRLDLSRTELLVLSACETARGHIDPIEGVWGLQRAFKQAGVKTILMTLWKVPDSTTALFMEQFYKNMISGVPIHEALKNAQNYLILNGAADPFYWAPFVILD